MSYKARALKKAEERGVLIEDCAGGNPGGGTIDAIAPDGHFFPLNGTHFICEPYGDGIGTKAEAWKVLVELIDEVAPCSEHACSMVKGS